LKHLQGSPQSEHPRHLPRFPASTISIATAVAVFNFGICYFRSFVFPNIPLQPWGDAVGFLNNGTRIVAGRLPYRDYFAFVPPGTELTFALLIREFGARSWIPNLMIACLASLTAVLMTLVASRLMLGPATALPGLLLAGFALPGSLDATHHWFSTVAVMGALLVLLDGETFARIVTAGALCGMAAFYTQSKGLAVLGFMFYLILKRRDNAVSACNCWPKCLLLLTVSLAVFLLGNAHFIGAAGLKRWWFCVAVFPLRYYPTLHLNSWRVYGDGWGNLGFGTFGFVFVHATVPLVYAFCIVVMYRWRKNEPNEACNKILLVCVTGIAMFLAVASAPSWKRLSTVSPPAIILLTWLLNGSTTAGFRRRLMRSLATLAVLVALAWATWNQVRWSATLDLPVGRTAFTDKDRYEEYQYILQRSSRGQLMFATPPVLFALSVQNPAPIDVFVPFEYTRPQQVSATIRALEEYRVPLLTLNRGMFIWPGMDPASDHLDPIRAYLKCNYHLTATFPTDDELWSRDDRAGRCVN
jgi:hypothetical protein